MEIIGYGTSTRVANGAGNARGRAARHILQGLLTERQSWKYEPDQSVIASGAGSGLTLNAAARSSEGNSILVYLSHSGSNVAIKMNRFTAGSAVRARWYNPTNGQYTTIFVVGAGKNTTKTRRHEEVASYATLFNFVILPTATQSMT
jgi:Putative collagen-binding domain of a collagenase